MKEPGAQAAEVEAERGTSAAGTPSCWSGGSAGG